MTIDDDNSIYVGGLPYETSEETLRRTFDLYGSVIAVKIINDKEVGGKCFGFVTFTNPRSAIDAITDMNGRTIGGRVVRVNEVRTRAGRPMLHRENFRRDAGRDFDWDRDMDMDRDRDRDRDRDMDRERDRDMDRGRDRERDYVRDRDRYRDRNTERSREHDREREKEYEHGNESDRARDHAYERGRDIEHNDERARDHERDWERGHDIDWDRDREVDKSKDHDGGRDKDKEQQSRNRPGSRFSDRPSKELSTDASDDYHGQVKEQLEFAIQTRVELQKEIIMVEDKLKEKEQHVSDLERKSQKLQDALADAKKLSAQRELMLTKLHRCFLQTQEYTEKLKSSEREIQMLVDTAMDEIDADEDTNTRNGSAYANGQV